MSRIAFKYCCLAWLLVGGLAPSMIHASVKFHWQSSFTPAEKAKLKDWIIQTDQALNKIVGDPPYTRHVYLYTLPNAREPVPWAHTSRRGKQSVHLYVDPRFPKQAFLDDWTAPHELSHLLIPYVGERHAWFAEGFASFMQYQVMQELGVLSATEAQNRYQQRVDRAQRRYDMDDMPFDKAAPKLRAQRQYPTMYWGGAEYFRQADNWLKLNRQYGLTQVLGDFLACCRRSTRGLTDLITALDERSDSQIFSEQLARFRTQPGFPTRHLPLE